LNLQDYLSISKICDQVLNNKKISKSKYYIPWLHIINEHPIHLKKYKDVFSNKFNLKKFLFFILIVFKDFLCLLHPKNKIKYFENSEIENLDILFISHLPSAEYIDKEDFYFGNVPEKLKKEGLKIGILLHVQGKNIPIQNFEINKKLVKKFLIPNFLDFKNEFNIFVKMIKLFIDFFKLYLKSNSKNIFKKNLFREASINAFSPDTRNNLRFSLYLKYFLKIKKTKNICVSFEGHAWERIAFYISRKNNPLIKCFGYQHAILFPNQHSIKRSLGKKYDPDIILTSGAITREKLLKYWSKYNIPCHIIGSSRRANVKKNISIKNKLLLDTCLVAPDGTISECNFIFNFAIKAAILNPNINFRFRLHPTLNFKTIISKNYKLDNFPKNIILSKENLETDFNLSKWILYRGSGTVIQSLLYGLRPLYLSIPNEICIDPLYDLNKWKKDIISQQDFYRVVMFDNKNNLMELEKDFKLIEFYKLNYQSSLKSNKLFNLIKE
jgi:hypothetical protein